MSADLALADPRRWWGGAELAREVARLDTELAAARAELAEVVATAARQSEDLGRTRDTLRLVRMAHFSAIDDLADARREVDGLRTELASTQHHRDLMCAKAETAVQERDVMTDAASSTARHAREYLHEWTRVKGELEAAQRQVLERDERLAATRPPGWDSAAQLHAAYVELLGRYEAAEQVLFAAASWRAAFDPAGDPGPNVGIDEYQRRKKVLLDAVDASTQLGRLQAELAEARSVADQAQSLASQRQAERARLRERYQRSLHAMIASQQDADRKVDRARAELAEQTQARLDATAGMRALAETIGRLTAERMDLDATVARLEQLPQRWEDTCAECAPRYVDELRAAISGGTAWDELLAADGESVP